MREALRDATAEANALRREIGIAAAPAEAEKQQALRALDRATQDRDAAKAELAAKVALIEAEKAAAQAESRSDGADGTHPMRCVHCPESCELTFASLFCR